MRGTVHESGVPHDDGGHLDCARVEVIPYERKLPAFAAGDPSEGPLSRGVLDEVSSHAKKDRSVKHEAEESRHPFLGTPVKMEIGCVSMT